ncbi:MAG: GNAT family N-acetyltransferase [bacterium]
MKNKYNFLHFTLILNLIFCSLLFAKQIQSEEAPTFTDANTVLKLYQLMKDTHEILTSKNIQYWVMGGTLLGAIRHNGIIPWDDDLDICINKNQEADFISLKPIFEQLKFNVTQCTFGYKILQKDSYLPFIDVFLYEQNGNDITYKWCKFKNPRNNRNVPIYANELFPLKDYKFGNIFVKGPKNPYPYLICCYGETYMDEAIYGHAHGKNKGHVKKGTMTLTKKDRIPAMPTGPLQDRISKILTNNQFTLETIQITQNNLIETQTLLKKLCPIYVEAIEKESEAQLHKEHPEEYTALKHKKLTIKHVLSEKFNKMIDVFISQIDLVKSYISIVKNDIGEVIGYNIFTQAPISQTIQSMISRNYITSVTSLPAEISSLNNQNDDLYILSLAVNPSFQKLGWGKKLIFSVLDQCHQSKNIYLLTAASEQNIDIQKFYEHLNFSRNGIVLTVDNNQKILYQLDKSYIEIIKH